jgi:PAS domain S-box-containing protein
MIAGEGGDRAQRAGNPAVVRDVFEEMPLMLVALEGPEHRFIAANAAYREFVGQQELTGMPVREALPTAAGQQVFEVLDRVYATGEPEMATEWRVQLDRGAGPEELWIDFAIAPRRAADGTVTGLLVYATDVTRRVAERQAAESELRYQAAREVVTRLQEALLPTALPVLPGARIAARYLVAAQDQAAGGDWFDAIPLSGGRVVLAVGDVVGHGVTASAAMGQLRAVLKYVLATEADLSAVLAQTDAFAAGEPALHAATLCLAVLDPADGTLVYATCGHPEPLIIAPAGTARFLPGTGGGPLGTGRAPVLSSATLGPGELVLLYSDGLIERAGRTLDEGKDLLATVAADAAADRVLPVGAAATAAERVCQLTVELLTRTGYADDVTTLAAQRLPAPVPRLTVERPAALASLAVIRGALDEWLDQIGPAADDRLTVRLAVIEAVTNAIEHAYAPGQSGPVRVEAALGDDGYVQARISDHGRWREPDPAARMRGNGLMLAGQMSGHLRVTHPPQAAGAPPGSRGTVVTLRQELHRPAMLASQASVATAVSQAAVPFAAELVAAAAPYMRVAGPVDGTTAAPLAGQLLSACRAGALPLTVDLTAVTLLASAGIRVLFEVSAQLAAHQQQLTLIAASGSPAGAVLDLVRLPRTAPAEQGG